MAKWIIREVAEYGPDDEELFWSNTYGFQSIREANIFSEEEQQEVNLPVGGEWVRAPEWLLADPDIKDLHGLTRDQEDAYRAMGM